eukprot:356191-Chlamydomonas_euryale.AAC.2
MDASQPQPAERIRRYHPVHIPGSAMTARCKEKDKGNNEKERPTRAGIGRVHRIQPHALHRSGGN